MSQYEREAAIDGIKRCSGTWTREDTDAITSASRYAEINEGASIMDFLMYTQFCRTVYQQNPCDIVQKFGCDMARAFEEASHAVELCNIDHGALKGALGWFCAWYADTRPSTREVFEHRVETASTLLAGIRPSASKDMARIIVTISSPRPEAKLATKHLMPVLFQDSVAEPAKTVVSTVMNTMRQTRPYKDMGDAFVCVFLTLYAKKKTIQAIRGMILDE